MVKHTLWMLHECFVQAVRDAQSTLTKQRAAIIADFASDKAVRGVVHIVWDCARKLVFKFLVSVITSTLAVSTVRAEAQPWRLQIHREQAQVALINAAACGSGLCHKQHHPSCQGGPRPQPGEGLHYLGYLGSASPPIMITIEGTSQSRTMHRETALSHLVAPPLLVGQLHSVQHLSQHWQQVLGCVL